jgi:hypothetical protein
MREDREVPATPIRQEHVVSQRDCPIPAGAKHNPAQQPGNSTAVAVEPHPATIDE